MPLYEYQCQECFHAFDLLRSMKTMNDSVQCPACGSKTPKRKISLFGVGSSSQERPCEKSGSRKPPSCGG